MDPVTTAIITAVAAGALSGVTDTVKDALPDAYHKLKDLIARKHGPQSEVVEAIARLEANPDSSGRRSFLEEEIVSASLEQDPEVLAAAQQILKLVQPQQNSKGKYNIQITGNVQGQSIGDHNTINQHFGGSPEKE